MGSNNSLASILALLLLFSTTTTMNMVSSQTLLPPMATPPSPPPPPVSCPLNSIKLAACADFLGIISVTVGSPPSGGECCSALGGLGSLEAAFCLCNVVNIFNLILPNTTLAISGVLNNCGTGYNSSNFQCQLT
ncbi:hypothetical protein PIB30_043117 [Stylosanthes scabra]|uniref:Hydrophobic seed protein domain-containing protein n=1 Tax=Stylosanthes scabra TaxID=79078 RepID=A0ABU6VDV6_9FABA|nr:hypothetical protein [Stylosanthes scabra]